MAEAAPERRTYRGNCHCGAFVFEIQLPEIKSVFECNCSICVKRGYLWIFPGKGNFNVVKGSEDELTTYMFGAKKLAHKFCPKCASPILGSSSHENPDMQLALNAHTIQGLNTWVLERTPFNGAAMGEPYQPPAHKDNLPTGEVEGGETYTGSCHCGALTVAVITKPLDETYQGAVECNCSNCERNGYIWIYPNTDCVVLSGDEDQIGRYTFGSGTSSKTFCKTCGVNMTSMCNPLTDEQKAALPEEFKKGLDRYGKMHPVNSRVLNGVDVTKVKTNKLDGFTGWGKPYVNP